MEAVVLAYAHVLRRSRKSMALSQSDLANKSGLDRTFISMLERGRRQPSLITIFALSKVLDLTPSDMIRQVENYAKRIERAGRARLPSSRL